jgi:hypothetical protein
MTTNRTLFGPFSAISVQIAVLVLLALAAGLTISDYFAKARESTRRTDGRRGRSTQRRRLAA